MNTEMLKNLSIPEEKKRVRKAGPVALVALVVLAILAGGVVFARTKADQRKPVPSPAAAAAAVTNAPAEPPKPGDVVLTVSGYVIPRERIAISPRFQGTVKTISVKKGDMVKKGDVLVQLEDDEQRARVKEAEGRLAQAEANRANARTAFERARVLSQKDVASAQELDDARRGIDAAEADVVMANGQLDLARTYLAWCTITAPIDGTVLEKLVNPNELVTPQSFGGSGPSTAFLAMADLSDLQVEIDLNEADTPKVSLQQPCRVSPEAYPDKVYEAYVAEIAPEANRSKGTLQIKVQVRNPAPFLTPELSAKVDFLMR